MVYFVDMTAKETTLSELGEMLSHVVKHMATKDDLAAVKAELKADIATLGEQIAGIERDLKEIRRDLYELADKVENISGYRKEIDHAFERIAAIERHLGIAKRSAA
jgi:septal ring factor EnvC (AmiA/AmiB activator)